MKTKILRNEIDGIGLQDRIPVPIKITRQWGYQYISQAAQSVNVHELLNRYLSRK